MSLEQNQSRLWYEMLQPVLYFAENLEQNPTIVFLKKAPELDRRLRWFVAAKKDILK